MKMSGCYKDFNTAEEVLEHLGDCIEHLGFGVGGAQVRYNGKECYLRVYDGSSDSRYITRQEALDYIQTAMSYVDFSQ